MLTTFCDDFHGNVLKLDSGNGISATGAFKHDVLQNRLKYFLIDTQFSNENKYLLTTFCDDFHGNVIKLDSVEMGSLQQVL